MNRYYFFLLTADDSFLLDASYQSFGGHFKIMSIYELFVVSCCQQSCFVTQICNLSATKTWSQRGQSSCKIFLNFTGIDCYLFKMNVKYLSSSFKVREVDLDHSVESSRPNQSSIQEVYSISCCHNNYISICAESIHLY